MTATLRSLFASALDVARETPQGGAVTSRIAPSGARVGLLGYGGMRLPTVDGGHANAWAADGSKADIDQKALDGQVDYMLAHGVNCFDSSPMYCRGLSEQCLGKALSRHERGKYLVSTKMSNFAGNACDLKSSQEMFARSLANFKTDYVDFYYLHNIGNGDWGAFSSRFIENGLIDWLFAQKRAGRIRNLGFSFHGDVRTLEWCLARHDEGRYRWDMALIQMNYVDWRHARDINPHNQNAAYLYEALTSRKIAVTVMEPLLGGRLARLPEAVLAELAPRDGAATPASWALRFCGSHDNVLTVLSGMTYREHIEENIRTFSPLRPLSRDDFAALERAAVAYVGCNIVPCNRCDYCMPCPYGLDIPGLLTLANRIRTEKISGERDLRRLYDETVPDVRRRADRCIGCRKCVGHCPQQINIPKALDDFAAYMEEFALRP